MDQSSFVSRSAGFNLSVSGGKIATGGTTVSIFYDNTSRTMYLGQSIDLGVDTNKNGLTANLSVGVYGQNTSVNDLSGVGYSAGFSGRYSMQVVMGSDLTVLGTTIGRGTGFGVSATGSYAAYQRFGESGSLTYSLISNAIKAAIDSFLGSQPGGITQAAATALYNQLIRSGSIDTAASEMMSAAYGSNIDITTKPDNTRQVDYRDGQGNLYRSEVYDLNDKILSYKTIGDDGTIITRLNSSGEIVQINRTSLDGRTYETRVDSTVDGTVTTYKVDGQLISRSNSSESVSGGVTTTYSDGTTVNVRVSSDITTTTAKYSTPDGTVTAINRSGGGSSEYTITRDGKLIYQDTRDAQGVHTETTYDEANNLWHRVQDNLPDGGRRETDFVQGAGGEVAVAQRNYAAGDTLLYERRNYADGTPSYEYTFDPITGDRHTVQYDAYGNVTGDLLRHADGTSVEKTYDPEKGTGTTDTVNADGSRTKTTQTQDKDGTVGTVLSTTIVNAQGQVVSSQSYDTHGESSFIHAYSTAIASSEWGSPGNGPFQNVYRFVDGTMAIDHLDGSGRYLFGEDFDATGKLLDTIRFIGEPSPNSLYEQANYLPGTQTVINVETYRLIDDGLVERTVNSVAGRPSSHATYNGSISRPTSYEVHDQAQAKDIIFGFDGNVAVSQTRSNSQGAVTLTGHSNQDGSFTISGPLSHGDLDSLYRLEFDTLDRADGAYNNSIALITGGISFDVVSREGMNLSDQIRSQAIEIASLDPRAYASPADAETFLFGVADSFARNAIGKDYIIPIA